MKRWLLTILLGILYVVILTPIAVFGRVVLRQRYLRKGRLRHTNWHTVSVSSHDKESYRRLY